MLFGNTRKGFQNKYMTPSNDNIETGRNSFNKVSSLELSHSWKFSSCS